MAMPDIIYTNFKEICVIPTTAAGQISVQLVGKAGMMYLRLQSQYKRQKDNVWKNSNASVSLPLNTVSDNVEDMVHQLEVLKLSIDGVIKELNEHGFEADVFDNYVYKQKY